MALSRSGNNLTEIDGYLTNIEGDIAFGHINVTGNSVRGPGFQHPPDVTVKLNMTESSCTAEVIGAGEKQDGQLRVERGTVVLFEYTNRTDLAGGVAIRTIPPGVTIVDLAEEATVGIPASFDAILAISFVAPGARTNVAALMAGDAFVPNCILLEDDAGPSDFVPMIVSPSA